MLHVDASMHPLTKFYVHLGYVNAVKFIKNSPSMKGCLVIIYKACGKKTMTEWRESCVRLKSTHSQARNHTHLDLLIRAQWKLVGHINGYHTVFGVLYINDVCGGHRLV